MKKDWIDRLADFLKPLEEIPIIGTPIAAVLMMSIGMAYWVLFITFFCFLLIPYSALRGVINPDIRAWDFLFGDTRRIDSPNRLDFAVLLAFYVLLYGGIAFILLMRR
jgi:hypothetical protein